MLIFSSPFFCFHRFNTFDLDYNITSIILGRGCDSDYLEVYDGSNTTAPRLARMCLFERTILTTGRHAFVVFQTDGSGTSSGFSAYFTAEIRGACYESFITFIPSFKDNVASTWTFRHHHQLNIILNVVWSKFSR